MNTAIRDKVFELLQGSKFVPAAIELTEDTLLVEDLCWTKDQFLEFCELLEEAFDLEEDISKKVVARWTSLGSVVQYLDSVTDDWSAE